MEMPLNQSVIEELETEASRHKALIKEAEDAMEHHAKTIAHHETKISTLEGSVAKISQQNAAYQAELKKAKVMIQEKDEAAVRLQRRMQALLSQARELNEERAGLMFDKFREVAALKNVNTKLESNSEDNSGDQSRDDSDRSSPSSDDSSSSDDDDDDDGLGDGAPAFGSPPRQASPQAVSVSVPTTPGTTSPVQRILKSASPQRSGGAPVFDDGDDFAPPPPPGGDDEASVGSQEGIVSGYEAAVTPKAATPAGAAAVLPAGAAAPQQQVGARHHRRFAVAPQDASAAAKQHSENTKRAGRVSMGGGSERRGSFLAMSLSDRGHSENAAAIMAASGAAPVHREDAMTHAERDHHVRVQSFTQQKNKIRAMGKMAAAFSSKKRKKKEAKSAANRAAEIQMRKALQMQQRTLGKRLRRILKRIGEIDGQKEQIAVKIMEAQSWGHHVPQVVFNGRPYGSILSWAKERKRALDAQDAQLSRQPNAGAHRGMGVLPMSLRGPILDLLPPITNQGKQATPQLEVKKDVEPGTVGAVVPEALDVSEAAGGPPPVNGRKRRGTVEPADTRLRRQTLEMTVDMVDPATPNRDPLLAYCHADAREKKPHDVYGPNPETSDEYRPHREVMDRGVAVGTVGPAFAFSVTNLQQAAPNQNAYSWSDNASAARRSFGDDAGDDASYTSNVSQISHDNSSFQSVSSSANTANGMRPRKKPIKKQWFSTRRDADKIRSDVATVKSGTAELIVGNVNNGVLPPMPRSPPPRNELYLTSGHSIDAHVAPALSAHYARPPLPPAPSFRVQPAADPTIFPVHAPKWKANGLKPNKHTTTKFLPSTFEFEQRLDQSLRIAEAKLEETVRSL